MSRRRRDPGPPARPAAPSAEPRIATHILPTAAAMAGVSITVVSLVRILETSSALRTFIDTVMALDGVVFLLSALFSYASLRSRDGGDRLERVADALFLGGLVVMVAASLMLAFELG